MDVAPQTSLDDERPEFLDPDVEKAALETLRVAAEQRMAQSVHPRHATYMIRGDTRQVIRNDAEYDFCSSNNIPIGYVSYGKAVNLVCNEVHENRKIIKRRAKNKTARKSRRANR